MRENSAWDDEKEREDTMSRRQYLEAVEKGGCRKREDHADKSTSFSRFARHRDYGGVSRRFGMWRCAVCATAA